MALLTLICGKVEGAIAVCNLAGFVVGVCYIIVVVYHFLQLLLEVVTEGVVERSIDIYFDSALELGTVRHIESIASRGYVFHETCPTKPMSAISKHEHLRFLIILVTDATGDFSIFYPRYLENLSFDGIKLSIIGGRIVV